MFTGIVEEVGSILSIKNGAKSSSLKIKSSTVLEGTKIGDSICTNGVCLTVTKIDINSFEVDVMAETLRKSDLKNLHIGSVVNLERALSLQSRLGGHIVSGHIDGVGKITSIVKEDNAIWISIQASSDILKYVIYKGSITIDGISLTVAYVDSSILKVSIIPHTLENTILSKKCIGDSVNLECDMIGKYVEKLLGLNGVCSSNKQSSITEEFLRSNGF